MKQPERLFHYCCEHSAADIRRDGFLESSEFVVNRGTGGHVEHPQGYVVWLTDMEPPAHRDALGLTSHMLKCNRITHCFEVELDWTRIEWYLTFRKRHREMRALEVAHGAMPAHWYVGKGPIKVKREVAV